MRHIILIIVLALLTALIGGFAYFQFVMKPEMIKGFITAGGQPPVTISAEAAQIENWSSQLKSIGTLTPVKGTDISPEAGGVVQEIFFESGQDIVKGQPIITVNDDTEQADLRSANAELRAAQMELQRKKALSERGNASKAAYDQALATRDVATANIARIKASIEKKKILAPFDGKLGIRQVNLGQYVSPGETLVTLQQLDPVYADFTISEQYLNQISTGLEISVTVDAFKDETFAGKIESIDSHIDPATRNIQVRAIVQNPDKKLLPGMFANVVVKLPVAIDVVTVPRTAVTYSLYGDSIFVVKKGEGDTATVERRGVKIGDTKGDRVSILDGLKEGENVVVNGQLKLYEGAGVVVDNSGALQTPDQRPKE
jgi:membrane fusion protein (multidrug efflux system)